MRRRQVPQQLDYSRRQAWVMRLSKRRREVPPRFDKTLNEFQEVKGNSSSQISSPYLLELLRILM